MISITENTENVTAQLLKEPSCKTSETPTIESINQEEKDGVEMIDSAATNGEKEQKNGDNINS